MEAAVCKYSEIDFPLKTPASGFVVTNGINSKLGFSDDIEMIALQTLTYTSLKDLMPVASTTEVFSSTYSRNQSWEEIPIKNPLVKHAAWAYLQPMSSTPENEDRSVLDRLKCGVGCCEFIHQVVVPMIKEAFGRISGASSEIDDDDGAD